METIEITKTVHLPMEEIELIPILSQGSGGQNVNKVSTAIHLRFNITKSSLPDPIKEKLLSANTQKITKEGVINLKIQKYRTQKNNKDEAIAKLIQLLKNSLIIRKKRTPTKPSGAAKKKRVEEKKHRGEIKHLRTKPPVE